MTFLCGEEVACAYHRDRLEQLERKRERERKLREQQKEQREQKERERRAEERRKEREARREGVPAARWRPWPERLPQQRREAGTRLQETPEVGKLHLRGCVARGRPRPGVRLLPTGGAGLAQVVPALFDQ